MANIKITNIIEKKRNGQKLDDTEIRYFISSFVKSSKINIEMQGYAIDRCQIGAMLMAMYLNGLDEDETCSLAEALANSGLVFTWSTEWRHLVVDRHSIGSIGEKVNLVLAPALAAVGLKVPMLTDSSLIDTDRTLSKLQSIPGFRVHLDKVEIKEAVNHMGCCIVGKNEDYTPAEKLLYECREMTGTVDYPPFMVSSIVSKKLCEGIKTLVYDVKFGKGSFFSTKNEAEETARHFVRFSRNVKASALLTSMENPLGKAIGHSLEIIEAIHCLKGDGPSDVIHVTCALGSELLKLVHGTSKEEGQKMIMDVLNDGRALEKFRGMIIQQGVSYETADKLCYEETNNVLPKVNDLTDIRYEGVDGFIQEINPVTLTDVWQAMLDSSNQHSGVGLTLLKSIGDYIKQGETWVRIHHWKNHETDEIQAKLKSAISVHESRKERVLIGKRLYLSDDFDLIEENYY